MKAVLEEKIWTVLKTPFAMGGNLTKTICTRVRPKEYRTIKEITFFSFTTPKGTVRICETKTGGIIALSFKELKKNIADCDTKFLLAQIESAKHLAGSAEELTNEEFFKHYRF